jgi:hypothetical protein
VKGQQKPAVEEKKAGEERTMGTRGLLEAPDQEPCAANSHPEGEDECSSAEESSQRVHHRLRTPAQQAKA